MCSSSHYYGTVVFSQLAQNDQFKHFTTLTATIQKDLITFIHE